jgi:hypothetical protein
MSLSDFLTENFRTLLLLAGGYALAVQQGYIGGPSVPEMPDETGIIVLGGLVLLFGGYVAAGKIEGLLPEDRGIFLVAFEASDHTGGKVYELSEDRFADLEVKEGTLFQWPVSERVYECRTYNPDANTAVAGWRGSPAASELAGGHDLEDAYAAIEELRDEYEPAQRKLNRIQRRLRSVARTLDRRRARDQNRMLEPNVSPTFDDEDAGVRGVIQDEFPDELLPDSLQEDSDDDRDDQDDEQGEFVDFSVLDDTEPEALRND